MSQIVSKLQQIDGLTTLERLPKYQAIINQLIEEKNLQQLKEVVDYVVNEDVQTTVSRPVMTHLSQMLSKLNNDQAMEIGSYAIDKMANRLLIFEEEDSHFKRQIAEIYAARKDFEKAARTLEKINVENVNRAIPNDEKAHIYIQTAEFWFEDDDAVNAEKYINKAAHIIHLVQDQSVKLRYKVCHSRIMDSKRKFLVASFSYYELSNQEGVDPADLFLLLGMAATCAILSPAGPQKSRILTVLQKDPRTQKLEQFEILDKMFMGKIIKKPDVKAFEESLLDHQKTVSQEGYSVLGKALIEHNIEVISKIYKNISFEELGRFLEISPQQAEGIIAQMVSENRIKATLDQKARIIEFEGDNEAITTYNTQILNVCQNVNQLIADILKVHPSLQKYDIHHIK
eukprot:403367974